VDGLSYMFTYHLNMWLNLLPNFSDLIIISDGCTRKFALGVRTFNCARFLYISMYLCLSFLRCISCIYLRGEYISP